MLDLQHVRHAVDDLRLLGLRHLADTEAERDIVAHRHGRIQRVRLEHHCDIAIFRRQVVHLLAVDLDLTLRHGLKTGNHVEQRRLTAARAAHQNQELAVFDVDVDTLQDRHPVRVGLVHVTDGKACHAVNPLVSDTASGASHEAAQARCRFAPQRPRGALQHSFWVSPSLRPPSGRAQSNGRR